MNVKNNVAHDAAESESAPGARAIQERLRAELDIDYAHGTLSSVSGNPAGAGAQPRSPGHNDDKAPLDTGLAQPAKQSAVSRPPSKWRGRVAKTAVALAVLLAVVWAPLQLLLQPSSVEAVINARLIVLRSPIEGLVKADALPAPGTEIAKPSLLLTVENPRAENSERQSLEQQLRQLKSDRAILARRLEHSRAEEEGLNTQLRNLLESRRQLLTTDIAIAQQRIDAAQQQWQIDRDDAQRASVLQGSGVVATATADKAEHVARISESNIALLKLQQARMRLEREALSRGILVDAGYNDRPQSQQRLDELRSGIAEMEAQIAAADDRVQSLSSSLAEATAMHERQSRAEIVSPQSGRVWEVLVSPGEQVNRGQDLIRLLSCGETVVTATVSERVYNGLYNGMAVSFMPRGSNEELTGTIVNLTGMASASSNYAITPASLVQEPYRVTISVPQLAAQGDCAVGRTGRVLFGTDAETTGANRVIHFFRSLLP